MSYGVNLQPLLAYRGRIRRQMIDEIIQLKIPICAFAAWVRSEGDVGTLKNASPFRRKNLANVRDQYLRRLTDTTQRLRAGGVEVVIFTGLEFATVRENSDRGFPFSGWRNGAAQVPLSDFQYFRGAGADGVLEFISLVVRETRGPGVTYIDGIEPWTPQLDAVPNDYTRAVDALELDILSSGVHVHGVNPGDPVRPVAAQYVDFDGWGKSKRLWDADDGIKRRYAALPAGNQHAVTQYFLDWQESLYPGQKTLILHSGGWSVFARPPAPVRPGIAVIDTPPWSHTFRQLAKMPPRPVTPIPDDDIDLSRVSIAGNSEQWLKQFDVTSRLLAVDIGADYIDLPHTMAGRWPTRNGDGAVEGNPWVFAQINGQWHGGTYEWLRPGQTRKGITAANIGQHIKRGPLASWKPRTGDRVGFCVSTIARNGESTIDERSNIVKAVWP